MRRLLQKAFPVQWLGIWQELGKILPCVMSNSYFFMVGQESFEQCELCESLCTAVYDRTKGSVSRGPQCTELSQAASGCAYASCSVG